MGGSPSTDQLPLRWALILMFAALIGVLFSALMFMQTRSWPAAALAGLGAAGAALVGAHQILAR